MRLQKRLLSLVMCFVFCAAFLLAAPSQGAADDTSALQQQIDDLNKNIKNLENENKELQNSIAAAKSEKEKEFLKRNTIDQDIRITKDMISSLEERIALQELDIADKQTDIEAQQKEIDAKYTLFLKRMRAMYMNDDSTKLGLLLGVDSFSAFLTQADSMGRVAEHDRKLITDLTALRTEMEETKVMLEERLAELESDRETAEEKRHLLSGQLQAVDLRIQDISSMEKEFAADLEKNKAMMAAMQAEVKNIYAKIEWSKNPYIGGEMEWPVPGFYRISSEFGWRFNNTDYHTGMDITGGSVYGASIVSANAGTVKYTNWSYSPGRGYGIYLIVDHGGGITTLYAHCSNIVVNVGDVVTKGQKIAEVGSTGWSTGAHLHFEVRVDGVAQNPKPYVIGRSQ